MKKKILKPKKEPDSRAKEKAKKKIVANKPVEECEECPICYETLNFRKGKAILYCGGCGKGFHLECIGRVHKNECPCCRQKVDFLGSIRTS